MLRYSARLLAGIDLLTVSSIRWSDIPSYIMKINKGNQTKKYSVLYAQVLNRQRTLEEKLNSLQFRFFMVENFPSWQTNDTELT